MIKEKHSDPDHQKDKTTVEWNLPSHTTDIVTGYHRSSISEISQVSQQFTLRKTEQQKKEIGCLGGKALKVASLLHRKTKYIALFAKI